jgi:hypothetical protein
MVRREGAANAGGFRRAMSAKVTRDLGQIGTELGNPVAVE